MQIPVIKRSTGACSRCSLTLAPRISPATMPHTMNAKLVHSVQLAEMEEGAKALNDTKELYELPIIEYQDTKNTREELSALKRMWDFKANVDNVFMDWNTMLWCEVDTEALDDANKAT